ncbi:hypothetical protein FFWV33_13590 [Flavobacterium faecale]|uniref:Uncharacterized protein n=1 Tax=Flavobacterium faecale TaxID=1355330 RepID=A0A2S1LFE9_9FLAO|nr:hypothetical protein [Flavobacterium faecale]AWG22485.1 hypothetical protein FFWV33_13590 [Flavobacterium faecale]
MQKIIKLSFLFIILSQFSYGQWTKGKSNGYYKLSASSLIADEHFTSSKQKDPNVTRGNFIVSAYAEYGLTDRIDAIAYVPLLARVYQNKQVSGLTGSVLANGEAVNSIGDIDLGLRYGLLKNDHLVVSATLKFGLPTGKSQGGSDGSLQTGDGEFNQLLQIDLGIPFKISNQNLYGKLYSGFNNRTKGFSDEFHFGAEVGTKIANKFFVATKFSNVRSLNNGTFNNETGQGIFANNVEFTNLGIEVAYYISSKFGVSVNYTDILSGKITYAAPTYTGGIFLDIQ